MTDAVSKDWVLRQRAYRYRCVRDRRVQTLTEARAFVDDLGFVHFWPIKDVELPNLFHAIAGCARPVPMEHDDADMSKCWGWKDSSLGQRWWYYGKLLRRRATLVSLEVLPSPLEGRGGTAYVVLDVTAERVAAEGRSAFISQIAHELRAPIQHIMGFSSIISDVSDLSEETLHRFLGHINDESRRLARLVDDLAELSRIEIGRFSINRQQVRVDQLLTELVARHTPSAASKDLTLSLEKPDEPVCEETDPARLEQVIGNLVENAVKFVPAGGRIDLSMDSCDDWLTIRVADTGPGIPSAAVARIFDRFYQVPPADGQSRKGMGLGLYISREIVRGLGGDISVETQAGRGCAFTVRLPRH